MKKLLFIVALLLSAGFAANVSQAATFRVGPVTDAACTHNTIQAALQTSEGNGTGEDNIYVARNQTYSNQRLVIVNQSVNIYGGFDTCADGSGSGRTRINGNGSHSVIEVVSVTAVRETVRLVNLEITGGGADIDHGGGIQLSGLTRLFVDNTSVHDNVSQRGAGIYFNGSLGGQLILIQGTRIGAFNEASISGGGIYCIDAPAGINTGVFIDDSGVGFNSAPTGAGIYLDNCYLRLISRGNDEGVLFNAASISGGGIFATNSSNIFATGDHLPGTSPIDARALISFNVATNGGGGGIYMDGSSIGTFRDVEISGNTATNGDGGGIYAIGGATVRLERQVNSRCAETCTRLIDNRAPSGLGGGVAGTNSDVSLIKAAVSGNEASRASAVYVSNGDLVIDSTVVAANEGADTVVEAEFATTDIRYASFANNLNQVADISATGGTLSLLSSIFQEQQGRVVMTSSGAVPTFGCLMVHELASLPASSTIVVNDPLFLDPIGGNYHLSEQSPAIDFCSGLAGGGTDIDYQFRGVDSTKHDDLFGPYDLGADEFDDVIFSDGFED